MTTDFGSRNDFGVAVAIQPDGKMLAAGNSTTTGVFNVDFALARYNSDGGLDVTFGSGGTVLTDFGTGLDAAFDVIVQRDGKIVAAGISSGDFALARYNAHGLLDPTFGSGGKVKTDFGSSEQATAVALQSDGKLVAVGISGSDFALARYNPDGSLDQTFGTGGKVTTDLGSADFAFDIAIATNGKIFVGGGTGSFPVGPADFVLARYNAQGSLDPSFGNGGIVTTDFGASDTAFAIALTAGGVIAAGASKATPTSGDFALARYTSHGSLDASFGTGGKVTTDFSPGSDDLAFGVVVQPHGRITAAGVTTPAPGSTSFALARYTSGGALDAGFGNGGKVTTTFGNPFNNGLDIAAQPDGKVVVVGGTGPTTSGFDFALARYLG